MWVPSSLKCSEWRRLHQRTFLELRTDLSTIRSGVRERPLRRNEGAPWLVWEGLRFFLSPGLGAWVGFKVRERIRKSKPGEVMRGQVKRDVEHEVSLEK